MKKDLHRIAVSLSIAAAAIAFLPSGSLRFFSPGAAHAQEDWRPEFDSICSKTQDADTLTIEELKELINRCDALKPRIEKLEESHRKVALKRLQMCKDLFVFILQSKENK
jgi:hypothetical protein